MISGSNSVAGAVGVLVNPTMTAGAAVGNSINGATMQTITSSGVQGAYRFVSDNGNNWYGA